MAVYSIIGLQFGDEGKGKIVDFLSDNLSAVVRFQGGNNAGHTLIHKEQKLVLHLIPSGVLHEHVQLIIGNGVVVSLDAISQEISCLNHLGINLKNRLFINPNCPLLLPHHLAIDKANELKLQGLGQVSIGTTRRGIGPVVIDKFARRGLRVIDILNPRTFREKLEINLNYANFFLQKYYEVEPVTLEESLEATLAFSLSIQDYICFDMYDKLKSLARDKNILLEGAQGAGLDIDFGTYPYVTCSNTIAAFGGVGSGLGVCKDISNGKTIGIMKSYVTRVGNGPLPTEIKNNELGYMIGEIGEEYGSTTGRKRRCGWLDIPMLRNMVNLNNVQSLCLTKLDVLNSLSKIKICTEYENPEVLKEPDGYNKLIPKYQEIEGWHQSLSNVNSYKDLPKKTVYFIELLESLLNCSIDLISIGKKRNDTIVRRNIFKI